MSAALRGLATLRARHQSRWSSHLLMSLYASFGEMSRGDCGGVVDAVGDRVGRDQRTRLLSARLPRPKLQHPPRRPTPLEPKEIGQRPDERVGAVGRKACGAAVEIGGQRAELVLEIGRAHV